MWLCRPACLCSNALINFFHQSDRSKWQTMKWTTMSGVCEPIGAALFGLLLKPFLTEAVVKGMLAAGEGLIVHNRLSFPRKRSSLFCSATFSMVLVAAGSLYAKMHGID
jgi:hypothetical protein